MQSTSKNYSAKLTDNKQENNRLNAISNKLKEKFNLTPIVGCELEFYLHGDIDISRLEQKINMTIKPEKGKNQYEVDLLPSQNLQEYASYINNIRTDIIKHAKILGGIADFSSKPFTDDYGNSMHIHLNFLEDNDVEKYAKILCHYLLEYIRYFLPKAEDFQRLDSKFMAPTHISYGGNNRTTVIRIPDSLPKRLEHRLASANSNPHLVIYAILKSIVKGLENPGKIKPMAKIYGNSFDLQYDLEKIIYPTN